MLVFCLHAREEDTVPGVQQGNLSMPTSQQPSPLFAFGQNIIDKNDLLFYGFFQRGKAETSLVDVFIPTYLYGIRDDLSILFAIPIIPHARVDSDTVSDLGDVVVQLEYAFYNKDTDDWANQATFVLNIALPTGNTDSTLSSVVFPDFFIGLTASHMAADWYYFTSHALVVPEKQGNIKNGLQYLYQFGIGKNMVTGNQWICNWMIELFGTFSLKDTVCGKKNNDSGGNILILAPSLLYSNQRLSVQLGVGAVIAETLFGIQPKNHYVAELNISWKF